MSAVLHQGSRLWRNSKRDREWNTLSEVDGGVKRKICQSGGSQLLSEPKHSPTRKRGSLRDRSIYSGLLWRALLPWGVHHKNLHLHRLGTEQGLLGLGSWRTGGLREWVHDIVSIELYFWHSKSGKNGVISPLSILILAKSIKRGTHVSHIKYKLGKDHFFCLLCCMNMNQFFGHCC